MALIQLTMPSPRASAKTVKAQPSFIDVFAGCGGLSLGLLNAGWRGRFVIEKNRDAFSTLAENLVRGKRYSFSWPKWLPKKACTTANLINRHGEELAKLRGKVDLLAGAPPCQGFSLAGRRLHSDPRNSLFREYLGIVKILEPRIVLVENVQGFSLPFKKHGTRPGKPKTYSDILVQRLRLLGYTVFWEMINFREFGVPQNRSRFILVAIKNSDAALKKLGDRSPFEFLRLVRMGFLQSKRLRTGKPISAKQAMVDLETHGRSLVASAATDRLPTFEEIQYETSRPSKSRFVALMRKGVQGPPSSLRLPRHRPATVKQFKKIIATCVQGRSLSESNRKRLGIKKQAFTPLHPDLPASTVTTLPDDMVHYSEPRVLTVRENARLQTFPDWFEFRGNYTTGGKARRHACPRYTQVGNAVPPLFSEVFGVVLKDLCS